jgi:hypothetical protein
MMAGRLDGERFPAVGNQECMVIAVSVSTLTMTLNQARYQVHGLASAATTFQGQTHEVTTG